MFERYTQRSLRVIFFARYEASQFGSTIIESEHLLLGLITEDPNTVEQFLQAPCTSEIIREDIAQRLTVRDKVPTSIDLPLSNECKRVLAYAADELERLGHRYIGTEHLLLAILREEKCIAAEVLRNRGLDGHTLRETLARSTPDPPTMNETVAMVTDVDSLLVSLDCRVSKEHLDRAIAAFGRKDWDSANTETCSMVESLVDEIVARLNEGAPGLPPAGQQRWQWLAERTPPFFPQALNEWKGTGKGFLEGFHARHSSKNSSDETELTFRLNMALLVTRLLIQRLKERLSP